MISKKNGKGFVELRKGILRKSLAHGERTHICQFILEKGSAIPKHSHHHEQTGYLIKGNMLMTISGEEHNMEEGDSWCIPGGTPHGVEVMEDSVVIEVFSPVREDYL